jgi:hypothetical protein
MTDRWYFGWNKERFGPFSAVQLKDLGALGKLQPTDTVWKEGTENGVLADNIRNLFSDSPAEALHAKAAGPVAYESSTRDAQLPEIIPNGLMLKVVPDQTDVAFSDSPSPINSPGSEEIEERALEASCALSTATDLKPITNDTDPVTQRKPLRKGRAIAVKGAVIISQDGGIVQYRKKCIKCAYEDACKNSMPIKNGVSRQRFFCPKCRKIGEVVIQGIT